ncbi:hypothetical protein LWI29_030460 [Acer saccharum]|uniref:Tetratricopeptide repeat protein 1 n=1 Tax=Acer saccharum TaxID=4024 RepID=A0AA39RFA4_ACESA|nr:hypothetical protein LWI29_030460 [Acer saccharum]KAK1550570.1 hypothetical protein Q3G72_021189 [Acer saccharum]
MVVIQQQQDSKQNSPKPSSSADSTVNQNGDASDGFETASERDVSDDENDHDHDQQFAPQKQEEERDHKNDAESIQRALSEASDAKLEGNRLFVEGKYEEALVKYEVALGVASGPETNELRSVCHSNRGICFFKLEKYEDTIRECSKALELNPTYMKALVKRGEAYEKCEKLEEAIVDMKKILELDPSNDQARRAIIRLEPLAAEKREKMKEEMIAKLKDMGNSVLGRFGMSVDNFKAVKDPNTGSYSISFQR